MEAQQFAMFDIRRLAKDACEMNIVNDRVKIAPQHLVLEKEFSKQGTSNLIQQK